MGEGDKVVGERGRGDVLKDKKEKRNGKGWGKGKVKGRR